MSIEEKEAYESSLNALGLSPERDPFPIESPDEVDYWADNKGVLSKIIKALIDSILFSTSSLYVFWGPIGVGKTFAANYLASGTVEEIISKRVKMAKRSRYKVTRVVAPFPRRTGDLTFGVHRAIVSKLLTEICSDEKLLKQLGQIYKTIDMGPVRAAFRNLHQKVTRTIFDTISLEDIETSEGFKFITGDKSKIGKLSDINDLITITKQLVKIALMKYTRIILMIDELENLAKATTTEKLLFSDYLRRLHDDIESGVSWTLIFTFDSYEDVQAALQSSLVSRIKEVIQFDYVNNASDVNEYIADCLKFRAGVDVEQVMDREVLDMISKQLTESFKGRLSFRTINIEMHDIFARTYVMAGTPKKYKIDAKLYQKSMNVGIEDIMKELRKD